MSDNLAEQPTSAEALSLATEFERFEADERDRLAYRIDALCEQRVSAALEGMVTFKAALEVVRAAKAHEDAALSAETERCARIAEQAEDDHGSPDYDFQSGRIGACQEIPSRIRAPAERTAPEPPLEIAFREAREEWERQARYEGPPPGGMIQSYWEAYQRARLLHHFGMILSLRFPDLYCNDGECPAPEGPQLSSEASAYLAGLAEDGGYGPDDVERAAEMYPMQDSLRGIGVEQLTQETPQPGCGWVLVPREPTEEMLSAGDSMMPQIAPGEDIATGYDALREAWPAMMAARPPVPSALASTGEQPEGGDALLREIALAAAHHLAGYDGDLVSSPAKDMRARSDRVEELLRQAGLYPPTDAGGLSSTDIEEDFGKGSV